LVFESVLHAKVDNIELHIASIKLLFDLLSRIISSDPKDVILLCELDRVVAQAGPPLWSSGQTSWLQTQSSRVRFPVLPDFLSSSGSGTGSTQPREERKERKVAAPV
jgi:hypothetical protein